MSPIYTLERLIVLINIRMRIIRNYNLSYVLFFLKSLIGDSSCTIIMCESLISIVEGDKSLGLPLAEWENCFIAFPQNLKIQFKIFFNL